MNITIFKNKKKPNRWRLFIKEKYDEASKIINRRLLVPVIKYLSVEYNKIQNINKQSIENVKRLDDDIEMTMDMDIDTNLNNIKSNMKIENKDDEVLKNELNKLTISY